MDERQVVAEQTRPDGRGDPGSGDAGCERMYAVAYPPAMCAADILRDRAFAEAMGYGWLHDENTEFARAFRQQVKRQAELYQHWLDQE